MNDKQFSDLPDDAQEKVKEVIETAKSKLDERVEFLENMYLRNLFLMNGGALVAILSARAALMASPAKNVEWTFWPMVFFFIGLLSVVTLILSQRMQFS